MVTIYTIGHSKKPLSEFLKKLKEYKIKVLIDIRSLSHSNFEPQYEEKVLRKSMVESGIEYRWRGDSLGGNDKSKGYEDVIDEICVIAKNNGGDRMCVMGSEEDYKNCRRYKVLEPSFIQRGLIVEHIGYCK